jgi:hypothetical protein
MRAADNGPDASDAEDLITAQNGGSARTTTSMSDHDA